jgi:hypothetical protein
MAKRKEGEKVNLPHELMPTVSSIAPATAVDTSNATAILESEIETLRETIEGLKSELVSAHDKLTDKNNTIDSLNKRLEFDKEELAQRAKDILELSRKCDIPTAEDVVEVVALPVNKNVIVAPFTINGKKAPSRIDEDGFNHFWVPMETARSLVGDKGGMKFIFVAPESLSHMDIDTLNGMYSARERFYRHVKRRNSTGEASWIQTIQE